MTLDRTIAPPFQQVDSFHIAQVESYSLDNGVPFFLLKAGTERVVRVEFIFNGGHWYEPYNGVSFFTSKLLSTGTDKYSEQYIQEQIALYGAFLDIVSGYDRSAITLYTLPKHLHVLLPLFKNMIKDSVFPETELDTLKKNTLQNFKVNQKKTSVIASQYYRHSLFGEAHPYSRTIDESAIENINKDDIKKFHYTNFNSANLSILVSGNADEDLVSLFNSHFGKEVWGSVESLVSNSFVAIEQKPFHKLIEQPQSVQSSIRMGCLLTSIKHPDYFKLNLLIEVFGGYFGSRLMKNIREEKGYTYGISASFQSLKNEGFLVIGTDVNKENTQNTIDEVNKEIKILQQELIPESELEVVTNYLSGSFLSSITTPFGLADRFKTLYYHGLDYSFYDAYLKSLKELTPDELRDTANKYLNTERLFEIVAGGK